MNENSLWDISGKVETLRSNLTSSSRHERVNAAIMLLDSGVPEYIEWADQAIRRETETVALMVLLHCRMRMPCSTIHLEFLSDYVDERLLFVIVECAFRRPESEILDPILRLKPRVGPLVRIAILGYLLKLNRHDLTSEAEIKHLQAELKVLDLYESSLAAPSPIFKDRKALLSRCQYLLRKFRKQRQCNSLLGSEQSLGLNRLRS